MSPNSHPSKAGSVVESDVSYNSIVKGWQTTGDQVTTSGLESVRVMIRRGIHLFNSDADHRRFFIYSFQLNYRHRVNRRGTGRRSSFCVGVKIWLKILHGASTAQRHGRIAGTNTLSADIICVRTVFVAGSTSLVSSCIMSRS